MTSHELFDMHLFDENATGEQVHCGKDTISTERRGVRGYLEDRLYGNRVGTICPDCKDRAVPFIGEIIDDLDADGRVDEAEDYRRLAGRLARETGQDRTRG